MIQINVAAATSPGVCINELGYEICEKTLCARQLDPAIPAISIKIITLDSHAISTDDYLYLIALAKNKSAVQVVILSAGLAIIFDNCNIEKVSDTTINIFGEVYKWKLL